MIRAVLFDIDGVLTDTLECNARYFSHVLQKFGGKPLSADEYRPFYHFTSKNVFKHFFPEKRENEIDEIIKYGRSVFPDFYIYARLNPNAKETLEILKSQFRIGIVTNKTRIGILEHFQISKFFDAAVTSSDVRNHKPHPEPVLLALQKLGVSPEEALYVGDALSDLEAGRGAGVKVIIYRNPEVKGDFNIKDLREISKIIEG